MSPYGKATGVPAIEICVVALITLLSFIAVKIVAIRSEIPKVGKTWNDLLIPSGF